MDYKITIRSLEQIIDEALSYGARYGEMRLMGTKDYQDYYLKCREIVMSNAKTRLLDDSNRQDSQWPW